jgi:hypothetical protein
MRQSLYEVSGRTDLRLNALEKFIAAPPIGEENIFYREAVTSPLTEDRAWYEISRLRLLGGKQVAALAAARRAYEADPAAENYEENLFPSCGWLQNGTKSCRGSGSCWANRQVRG